MSRLAELAEEYLRLRRSLGYKLAEPGRLLAGFVADMEEQSAETITVALALEWSARSTSPSRSARRLEAVRGLARYVQAYDPATEVPGTRILPARRQRPTPHIFSDSEVTALMVAARTLQPRLWAATCETAIGLLAVTGVRVGELLRLDRSDIDWDHGTITVWFTKFGKSRHVPLESTTLAALQAYRELCRRWRPASHSASLLASRIGAGRLSYSSLYQEFVRLAQSTGLGPQPGRRAARLGDFRHSFAVHTLLRVGNG